MLSNGVEGIFDTVASSYEKIRPGYPKELYKTVMDYSSVNEKACVVEVGSGAGQATTPFLQSGCRLIAVEYGEQFSELLREKFKQYSRFSVITGKFEETEFDENSYDLVFSATAFHWVPEKQGYEKVYSMLKKGGAFARFRNHPYLDRSNLELSEEIDELYDQYYSKKNPAFAYTTKQAEELALVAGKYGFTDIKYEMFYRDRVLTSKEYVQLLGTYSGHMAIPEEIRTVFFEKIEAAINKHGGTITIHDTIDLQLARKP